jgi:two-component system, cell cycle sensor histidine kinase and response regulator CckA
MDPYIGAHSLLELPQAIMKGYLIMADQKNYILLLDDDEDDYCLLKSMLHTAFNGKVVLNWYQRDAVAEQMICKSLYCFALIDYKIGADNGIEVIKRVKADCPEKPLFLFTSWNQELIREQALQAGAAGVIHKDSLSIDMLKELVEPLLVL